MVSGRMITSLNAESLRSNATAPPARWPSTRAARSPVIAAVPLWTHHGQREDGHLVLGIVGQVLVQVAQAVGVLAELVIHDAQLVTRCDLPAGSQGTQSCVACSMLHLALPVTHQQTSGASHQGLAHQQLSAYRAARRLHALP